MPRDDEDRQQIQQDMEQEAVDLVEQTRNRRTSVLPENAPQEAGAAANPWQIASNEQLSQWVEDNPTDVLTMLNQLRHERDRFRSITKSYSTMRDQKEAANQALHDAQEQLQESNRIGRDIEQQRLAAVQRLNTLETNNLRNLNSPRRDSSSPESAQALDRNHRRERTLKIQDPEKLSDGKDPTWEEWSAKVLTKLEANPLPETAKIAWIYSVLKGKAANYTLHRRQLGTNNPYLTAQDLLDELAEIYANTDRIEENRRSYNDLKQAPNQTFQEFYAEFSMLGKTLGYTDDHLKADLVNKVNFRLQEAYGNTGDPKQTLADLKTYFRSADSSQRAIYQAKQQQRAAKEKVTLTPVRRAVTTTPTGRPYPTAGLYTPLVKPAIKAEVSTKTQYYNCGESGHYKSQCTQPKQNDAGRKASEQAKVYELGIDDESDDEETFHEVPEESLSDSGNE